jgi:N-acylneuraminate cytidylyltransferase
MPFFTQGYEGFDVNHPIDWETVAELVENGEATLPVVSKEPYLFKECA